MIANKSVSFLIDKYSMLDTPTKEDQGIKTLQSMLLRACVIVEEAEGRNITNQAMLHQLNILRKEMYRGYFIMDNFRSQTSEDGKSKDHEVSHPFAISKFNPVKRLFFQTRSAHGENELQQVLDSLNKIIIDMRDFIVFMKEYPPLHRQPYSMHLFLDKCMFGRQMEMERIMNFLMTEGPPSAKGVDVLPIVGPATVGKSTLVGHVCNDERVRNNFARIVFVTEVDIKDDALTNLKDGGLIIHQNNSPNRNERLLYIIEFPEDVDEAGWQRYLIAFATRLAATLKIIVTSRSSKIIGFGTTQALILNFLPQEAHWYFFKVITFGSAYPSDHPKLESIAMDLSRCINGSFKAANIVAGLLRDSFDTRHWCVVHKFIKLLMEMNICSSAHEFMDVRPKYLKRMVNNDEFIIYDYHESFADDMVPKTTLCDVLFGSVRCEGKFKVLSWKSCIPPYKNYIYTCDMKKKTEHSERKKIRIM